MSLIDAVTEAMSAITNSGHQSCLVGGLAVSARSEPRFTRDADLAVAVGDDADAEQLVNELQAAGYTIDFTTEQTSMDRLATVRVMNRRQQVVDLLFASSGIEDLLVEMAENLEIVEGVTVPTARTGHLIALKLLSNSEGRETDAMDLRNLGNIAEDKDWKDAETAVALIASRGYHRGRDLVSALNALRFTLG